MEASFDASFDPMFQINEMGIIQTANNAATETFSWTHEELIGNTIRMIAGGRR
jgi:PAS domain S-box-containing protein